MRPSYLIGDEELNSNFPFSLKIHRLREDIIPHGHNFIEYTYVFDGHGTEIINGVEHELKPGIFTLLFPNQIHEILVDEGEQISLFVGGIGLKAFFNMDDSLLPLNKLWFEGGYNLNSFYALDGNVDTEISSILRRLHSEAGGNLALSRVMFKAKLSEMLVLLYRFCLNIETSYKQSSVPQKINNWNIIYFVYRNFREDITLKYLSERFYLSEPYISALFKQYIGENFHRFLNNIRIGCASSLLASSELNVTDIAFEVGYKSYKTFVRVFHQQMKMSPTEYRRFKAINLNNEI